MGKRAVKECGKGESSMCWVIKKREKDETHTSRTL